MGDEYVMVHKDTLAKMKRQLANAQQARDQYREALMRQTNGEIARMKESFLKGLDG